MEGKWVRVRRAGENSEIDEGRRNFLKKDIFCQAAKLLTNAVEEYKDGGSLEKQSDYFESFEKCYPLLSEAGEMLMEEAIKQGIETKGKSKLEIAKEIFSSQVQSKRIVEKEMK
jgi:hypothetical protein